MLATWDNMVALVVDCFKLFLYGDTSLRQLIWTRCGRRLEIVRATERGDVRDNVGGKKKLRCVFCYGKKNSLVGCIFAIGTDERNLLLCVFLLFVLSNLGVFFC